MDLVITFAASFAGTVAFAAILHAPLRSWLPAGLIGAVGYVLYVVLLSAGLSEPVSMFLGALTATLLGQFIARRMKLIATIFVTLAIIPCVPGLGLYRCMRLLGEGLTQQGAEAGITAMMDILMLALAIGVSSFLAMLFPRKESHP